MKTLILLNMPVDQVTIPVLRGQRVRVVSLFANVGPNEGEIANLEFRRGADVIARVSSNRMPASVSTIGFMIGCNSCVNAEAMVDPATGVVTYEQNADTWSMPLPDVWLDWSLTLVLLMIIGGATGGQVIYELDDGKP